MCNSLRPSRRSRVADLPDTAPFFALALPVAQASAAAAALTSSLPSLAMGGVTPARGLWSANSAEQLVARPLCRPQHDAKCGGPSRHGNGEQIDGAPQNAGQLRPIGVGVLSSYSNDRWRRLRRAEHASSGGGTLPFPQMATNLVHDLILERVMHSRMYQAMG